LLVKRSAADLLAQLGDLGAKCFGRVFSCHGLKDAVLC